MAAAVMRKRPLRTGDCREHVSSCWGKGKPRRTQGEKMTFVALIKSRREALGTEKKMVDENIAPFLLTPGTVYSRLSDFTNTPVYVVHVVTTVAINERGQVDNFEIVPERMRVSRI
jgi:hypothetical protein